MRSDGDSWDIETSVGATALLVAGARALAAQRPTALAVDPYAAMFCRAAGGQWADLLDGKARDHQLRTEFGQSLQVFMGLRTHFFDQYSSAAAAAGIRQVVILAAGLDSRGYRLTWPSGTVVFELDQAPVLAFKREVLTELRVAPTAQRREVPIDLRGDWMHALQDNGFDAASPSAWLVEGLLMYLRAADRQRLFIGIDALSSPDSRVGIEDVAPMDAAKFTAFRDDEGDRGLFSLFYNDQDVGGAQWFDAHGWTVDSTPALDYGEGLGLVGPAPESKGALLASAISVVTGRKGPSD